jgi:hypothetical protein
MENEYLITLKQRSINKNKKDKNDSDYDQDESVALKQGRADMFH